MISKNQNLQMFLQDLRNPTIWTNAWTLHSWELQKLQPNQILQVSMVSLAPKMKQKKIPPTFMMMNKTC